ncbi:hypothetical protein HMPREF9123_1881 [Neisseria bacilliformis ATCC BAA-1200]|uniref:Uncharacterized protein n=1 Tax=Neisseria bacilliformis ATCC BAA-1200 TaxID=888742 RepID=F2BDS5_9NEIS|nr:hypothetical protein HMPREF9123_1881 [Neisseria bacilliformis ATCC BAA-1200]
MPQVLPFKPKTAATQRPRAWLRHTPCISGRGRLKAQLQRS